MPRTHRTQESMVGRDPPYRTYVWKTEKAWAGTCRHLIIKLNDGTDARRANFHFTK